MKENIIEKLQSLPKEAGVYIFKVNYDNQLCLYRGETLTLDALRQRLKRMGIDHPTAEAKKYLIKKEPKTPIEFYDVYP